LLVGLVSASCSGPQRAPAPADDRAASLAHFAAVASVLEHARCMNCHPQGDTPRWGEAGAFRDHPFYVTRGPDDHGAVGLSCSTCHGPDNYDRVGVPGNPRWALAPRKMGWVGLSRGELCRRILDPEANGHRSLRALVTHMLEDKLVRWAWEPGVRPDGTPRERPPLTQPEFAAAVNAWADTGAHCPD
jgi:hypothetical protein